MFIGRPTAQHIRTFPTYKRKGTIPNRLIPKKVGSKSARRERVYKRAAETRRDFFRRGGARQAGGCHALPRGTELSGLCSDEVCVPYKRKPIRLNCRVAAPVALLFLLKFLYGAGGNGSYIRGVLHFLRYGCQRVNDRCVCFFEILAYFLKREVCNLF